MGEIAKKLVKSKQRPDEKPEPDQQEEKQRPDEANALKKLQAAAKAQGCILSSGGKGGLQSSLVWHVFKRDAEDGEFRCKVCGDIGTEDNGGLGVHHKYQHITDPKARAKGVRANEEGRRNDPNQLIVICATCHDKVHQKDRAENPGEPDADELEDEENG